MTDSNYSNGSATMADINLQQIHDDLVSIALKAGQMILSATPSVTSLETKKSCKFYQGYLISFNLTC
jgi:hypothetical protein